MALIDKASLLMVPSTYEDGTLYNVLPSGNKAPDETGNHNGYDQTRADFTFSRGSNLSATRINSDGLIEKGRENLLLQSNQFDTTWSNANITLTSGQSGYDGSNNAWKFQSNAAGTTEIIQTGLSSSLIKTHSVYAKAGNVSTLKIYAGAAKEFNLSDGTTSSSNSKITSVGGGWYRCEVFDIAQTFANIYISATAANEYIYIQDAQVELGLVATDYIETGATTATAGVLENTPRIDYSSGAGALLLEPQRTNGNAHSEYFAGTGFGIVAATQTPNAATSPEGVTNATSFVGAASSAEHIIYTTGSTTYNGSTTISIFAKANGYDYFVLGAGAQSKNKPVLFNIANGTKVGNFTGWSSYGAPIDSDIEDYGNGWYRLWVTFDATSGVNTNMFFGSIPTDSVASGANISTQNGTDGSFIYGAQIEAGTHVSSYVPTYGSAATRGADSCSVTGVSDVIGQTEGTMYLDIQTPDAIQSNTTFSIGGGTSSEYAQLEIRTDLSINWRYRAGGVDYINANVGSYSAGDRLKLAFGYKNGDSILYLNGSSIATDTGSIASNSWDEVKYSNFAGTGKLEASVKETILFNERLSNTELAALTA